MTYSIFLDDERFPASKNYTVNDRPMIVRSVKHAKEIIDFYGCPQFISFDHDLGENQETGYDLAKWIVQRDLEEDGKFIPSNFVFYVHSQNPIGKENIEKYIDNYRKMRYNN